MKLSENAKKLLELRYLNRDNNFNIVEKPLDMFKRVAKTIASVEKNQADKDKWEKAFYLAMKELEFMPNSPCLMNAGLKDGQLFACMSGDTIIHTLRGEFTIRDLCNMYKPNEIFEVYSTDGKSLKIGKAFNPRVTKKNAKVYEITLKVGNLKTGATYKSKRYNTNVVRDGIVKIKLTEDHRVMLIDGNYVQVKDLKINDSVMPFNHRYCQDLVIYENIFSLPIKAQNFVYKVTNNINNDEIKCIHHKNENHFDNSSDNLKELTTSEHMKYHLTINNPMFKDECRNKVSEKMIGNKSAQGCIRSSKFKEKLSINNGMKNEEISNKVALTKAINHLKLMSNNNYELTEENYNITKKPHKCVVPCVSTLMNNGIIIDFNDLIEKFEQQHILCNHKIIDIQYSGKEDVYDLSVHEYHNFAANGIFIHNCFVIPVDDSIESIMEAAKNVAFISRSGGGVGISFNGLRPEGALVNSSKGKSSGPISFMEIFNTLVEVIKQGGRRKGALMGILNIDHQDIEKFITIKNDLTKLTNFNISVGITDEFMNNVDKYIGNVAASDAVNEEMDNANKLFNKIAESAWRTGEPGLIFLDTANKANYMVNKEKFKATNPCLVGDTLIQVIIGKKLAESSVGDGPYPVANTIYEDKLITLKEAYDYWKTGEYNISTIAYDEENNKYIYTPISNIQLTRENAEIVRIKLSDNTYIKCTSDHKIMLSNNTYEEASNLQVGDSLKAFYMEHFKNKSFSDNTNGIKFIENNITVEEVKSYGTKDVYDITVPSYNNFAIITKENQINNSGFALDNYKSGIIVHNCAEQFLLDYESCVLGSINLNSCINEDNEFDEEKFVKLIRLGTRFLDNCIDVSVYPLPQIEEKTKLTRKIGLGIMGFADILCRLNIRYDSDDALKLAERLAYIMRIHSYAYSELLANEKGRFADYEYSTIEVPRRNCNTTTIAPTGSISIISNCSSAIEPFFSLAYTRTTAEGNEMIVSNQLFINALEKYGYDKDQINEILKLVVLNNGSCQGIPVVPDFIQDIFIISNDISPASHIRIQAAFQKHIDSAISKTINMPESATVEDVKNAYMLAWKSGCKGITVYRNNSRQYQPLQTKKEKPSGVEDSSKPSGVEDLQLNTDNNSENCLESKTQPSGVEDSINANLSNTQQCPQCGSQLIVSGKCKTCVNTETCGWSTCNI